jgi:hypothetical protein
VVENKERGKSKSREAFKISKRGYVLFIFKLMMFLHLTQNSAKYANFTLLSTPVWMKVCERYMLKINFPISVCTRAQKHKKCRER